jgi:hypothetical protein
MQFVSKQQTYEAARKLLLEWASRFQAPDLENLARNMEMDNDHSRDPKLYQSFLDTLMSDPLEPQDALDAASQFLENAVGVDGKPDGKKEVADMIHRARVTAQKPEDDPDFWNHWIGVLESV